MFKQMLVLAACIASLPAAAQADMASMTAIPGQALLDPDGLTSGYDGTPTMRANKAKRALALRAEAAALLEQDGGTLTPAHEAYIRGKACDILGAPRQRCAR